MESDSAPATDDGVETNDGLGTDDGLTTDVSPATDGVVVGIDAGGTHTRVGVVALDGTPVVLVSGGGGGLHHNPEAATTVRATVREALARAGVTGDRVRALVAGVAGVATENPSHGDRPAAHAAASVALEEVDCPTRVVNDAVIAHRGALSGSAGIIVVAGTGSMVLGIDSAGRSTESGHVGHYAGAARHLVRDVLHRYLAREHGSRDPLGAALPGALGEVDEEGVRLRVASLLAGPAHVATHTLGALAPLVTEAADRSPLADAALTDLAERTARGVRLLVPAVTGGAAAGDVSGGREHDGVGVGGLAEPAPADRIRVACAGSLATDPAFRVRLDRALARHPSPPRLVSETPDLDPVCGAVLLALDLAGAPVDDAVRGRLRRPFPGPQHDRVPAGRKPEAGPKPDSGSGSDSGAGAEA